jgi:exopolysaccharide biosynthesis WecB/TagA/CpsF family protein
MNAFFNDGGACSTPPDNRQMRDNHFGRRQDVTPGAAMTTHVLAQLSSPELTACCRQVVEVVKDVMTISEPVHHPSRMNGFRSGSLGQPVPLTWPRVQLAGAVTDLLELDDAIGMIMSHAEDPSGDLLGVVSINLDHVHHFGSGLTLARLERKSVPELSMDGHVRWMALLDGAPLVRKASELTGRPWPRLAGSDLIGPILDEAERRGLSVGFLGGSAETHALLKPILGNRWPRLRVAGLWSPVRAELDQPGASSALAADVRQAGVDILAVCLGKPRQERWIAEYGASSRAPVCLAFGAAVDFLAGRVQRAPRWVVDHGLEWAWRLQKEPSRLARRYLIQGPQAYWALQRDSSVMAPTSYIAEPATIPHPRIDRTPPTGLFSGPEEPADVAVVVVTHNNANDIERLLNSIRRQLVDQAIRVIVADNNSGDDTLARIAKHPDVIAIPTGNNLGYAGGINAAWRFIGRTDSVLVLNPDLEMEPGALERLRRRLHQQDRIGAVVPRLLEANGEIYASLRREPTLSRAIGDALLGERFSRRPSWLSEVEFDQRQYRHAHTIDWATGAAILISVEAASRIGDWDEQFFLYSEEVDYLRRLRNSGYEIWYEPRATMLHRRGGSGTSDLLEALTTVNRIRYQEKWNGRIRTMPFRGALILGSILRSYRPRQPVALRYLLSRNRWSELPARNVGKQ